VTEAVCQKLEEILELGKSARVSTANLQVIATALGTGRLKITSDDLGSFEISDIDSDVARNLIANPRKQLATMLPEEIIPTDVPKLVLRTLKINMPVKDEEKEVRTPSYVRSVSLNEPGKGIRKYRGLKSPAIIYLDKFTPTPPLPGAKIQYSCRYFDTVKLIWTNDGCQMIGETIDKIICSCTHFTDFATVPEIDGQAQIELPSPIELRKHAIIIDESGLVPRVITDLAELEEIVRSASAPAEVVITNKKDRMNQDSQRQIKGKERGNYRFVARYFVSRQTEDQR
jgi:hypothetical protein